MKEQSPFPEGVALGEAFINRQEERKVLMNRIRENRHTVLMAPRRYGKTSLVLKVADEMKLAHCVIDLLAAHSDEYVRDQISDKVGRLVMTLLPKLTKARTMLISIFKSMKPEISVGAFGQKLSLTLSGSPLQDITDLLLKLDETAQHFKKRVVIFIDEFQQISQLKNYHSIEASIRHAAERSKHIAYVFSGSHCRLLQQMFGEHGRPLYRLCQMITVERMGSEVYVQHLQALAKARWRKLLSVEALEALFQCTELHPFYMNVLCHLLWQQSHVFTPEIVKTVWRRYVKTQRHVIAHDIVQLSRNQRKIMTVLAKSPAKEIQSVEFTTAAKISASSAQQSMVLLMRQDLVYKTDDGFYRVLDPAMQYYLDVVLWEDF